MDGIENPQVQTGRNHDELPRIGQEQPQANYLPAWYLNTLEDQEGKLDLADGMEDPQAQTGRNQDDRINQEQPLADYLPADSKTLPLQVQASNIDCGDDPEAQIRPNQGDFPWVDDEILLDSSMDSSMDDTPDSKPSWTCLILCLTFVAVAVCLAIFQGEHMFEIVFLFLSVFCLAYVLEGPPSLSYILPFAIYGPLTLCMVLLDVYSKGQLNSLFAPLSFFSVLSLLLFVAKLLETKQRNHETAGEDFTTSELLMFFLLGAVMLTLAVIAARITIWNTAKLPGETVYVIVFFGGVVLGLAGASMVWGTLCELLRQRQTVPEVREGSLQQ